MYLVFNISLILHQFVFVQSSSLFSPTSLPHEVNVFQENDLRCPLKCRCTRKIVRCVGAGYTEFPSDFPVEMVTLDFARNFISKLTQTILIKLTRLHSIDLISNNISVISDTAFINMVDLNTLILANNRLAFPRPGIFSPLRSLRILDLSGTSAQFNAEDYANFTNLENLGLNDLQLKTFPTFCRKEVPLLPKLSILRLDKNSIDSVIAENLRCLKELSMLSLQDNKIDFLLKNTFGGLGKLEKLWLQRNHPLSKVSYLAFKSTSLKVLSLTNSGYIGKNSNVFTCIQGIEHLFLANIKIQRSTLLPVMFKNLRQLTLLDLTGVDFRGSLPTTMLENVTKLKSLFLSNTNIGTYLDRRFFSSFSNSLEELDMAKNKLAIINKTSLPVDLWNSLRRIDLSENPFICDCNIIWFRRWMIKSNVSIFRSRNDLQHSNILDYRCNGPADVHGKSIITLSNQIEAECIEGPYDWTFSAIFMFEIIIMMSSSLASILHRYRWHVKYWLFVYKVKCCIRY